MRDYQILTKTLWYENGLKLIIVGMAWMTDFFLQVWIFLINWFYL